MHSEHTRSHLSECKQAFNNSHVLDPLGNNHLTTKRINRTTNWNTVMVTKFRHQNPVHKHCSPTRMSYFHVLGNGYFYQSFEGDPWGKESGDRVEDVEPYCGRKALYNPDEIFEEDETYIRDEGKGQKFDVQTFPQVKIHSTYIHF